MKAVDATPLFQPLTIRGLELPNRFVVPGMQREMSRDGAPTAAMRDYLSERARGGFGLIISESCAIDHPAATDQPTAVRMAADTVAAWQVVLDGVHEAGGRMFLQLWHEGAARKSRGEPVDAPDAPVSPSGLLRKGTPNGRAATLQDLEDLRDAYVRSATLAKELGFDGIEIHAAHGYLLDQFLWHETNQRSDQYGGPDLEARLQFPVEVVEAVRQAVGNDLILSLRFSQWKEVDFEACLLRSPQELDLLLRRFRSAGIDMFHVSTRRFYLPEWGPSDRTLAAWAKLLTDAPVITVGSVGLDTEFKDLVFGASSKAVAEASLKSLLERFEKHEFDLVAVGRGSIGDGQWVNKVRAKQWDNIRAFERTDLKFIDDWDPWVFDEGSNPDGTPKAPSGSPV